jgi:hypothetical protein
VAEEHDVRRGFFIVAQNTVMVSIEQVKDRFEGCLAMAVLENFDVGIFGVILVKKLCDLDGVMVRIVVAEESADKTYQDVSWGLRITDDSALRRQKRGRCSYEQEEHPHQRTISGETKHAELLIHQMTQLREGMRLKSKQAVVASPQEAISPEASSGKAFGLS